MLYAGVLTRSPTGTNQLMDRIRGLSLAAYLVGGAMVLLPLVDASLSITPFQLTDVHWRFGASGLVANAMLMPTAGLLLLLVTAIWYGHARVRRTLGAAAFVAMAFCVLTFAMFTLDAVQTHA